MAFSGEDRLDGLAEDDLLDETEVTVAVRECVGGVVGDHVFNAVKVEQWSNTIIEQCLGRLINLARPFKYIVTVIITQRAGAGMHVAATARWNPDTDGRASVIWENATMHITTTVFWLAH